MEAQTYKDVPATPTGEAFLNPPMSYVVVHTAIGLENPIDDIESLKAFFSNSIMLKIPRFSSLLVKHPNGRHSFRSTKVDIDNHFIVRCRSDNETHKIFKESEYEDLVNDYMAELATAPPMSTDKPLWEIHVLVDARCLVLRSHHAIGDGTSLMSMIREIGSSSGNPKRSYEKETANEVAKSSKGNFRMGKGEGILGLLRYVWHTTVFGLEAGVKVFITNDKGTLLNANKGEVDVGYGPRKIATARFNFDDVKSVKKAIPNATINDVMCGIIWGGLIKYIAARCSSGDGKAPREGQQITGALMANVRKVPGLQDVSTVEGKSFEKFWGNKTGAFLLPLHYTKRDEDVLSFVRKAKSILDKKKQSAESRLTRQLLKMVFHVFGPKVASKLLMRSARSTTFGFTNAVGPSEQLSIDANPVSYLRGSLSSISLGIFLVLLSYQKNLEMQIMVDKDVIPDPKILVDCFKDTFQEMMDALKNNIQ